MVPPGQGSNFTALYASKSLHLSLQSCLMRKLVRKNMGSYVAHTPAMLAAALKQKSQQAALPIWRAEPVPLTRA